MLKKKIYCLLSICYRRNRTTYSEALENIFKPKTVGSVILNHEYFASFHLSYPLILGTFAANYVVVSYHCLRILGFVQIGNAYLQTFS